MPWGPGEISGQSLHAVLATEPPIHAFRVRVGFVNIHFTETGTQETFARVGTRTRTGREGWAIPCVDESGRTHTPARRLLYQLLVPNSRPLAVRATARRMNAYHIYKSVSRLHEDIILPSLFKDHQSLLSILFLRKSSLTFVHFIDWRQLLPVPTLFCKKLVCTRLARVSSKY